MDYTASMTWFKGTLNTQQPCVEYYAQQHLSAILRKHSDFKLYYTCKMLDWFSNPQVELVHPMIITEHNGIVTSAHPGQTRFLAACIMGVNWPARVRTNCDHTLLLNDASKTKKYTADQTIKHYVDNVKAQHMHTAVMLENKYAHCDAWQFYHSVHDWVVAKRC
jgi:hypothetical protein